jgi:hypothetical protein
MLWILFIIVIVWFLVEVFKEDKEMNDMAYYGPEKYKEMQKEKNNG